MEKIITPSKVKHQLLEKFNNRNSTAFSEIYSMYYSDFHNYTSYLYRNTTVDSADAINDVFLTLWERKAVVFDDIIKIKAYVLISIKNNFKNYLKHLQCENRYEQNLIDNNFTFNVIECEVYTMIEEAIGLLPEECAKVFKLYLEGYKPDEIATLLGKKPQTIYNKKQEAIAIIKKKMSKDVLIFLNVMIQ